MENPLIHSPEYFVKRRSILITKCSRCNGTGEAKRTFRKSTFVESCGKCKGTKKEQRVYEEEIPLLQALQELSIVK